MKYISWLLFFVAFLGGCLPIIEKRFFPKPTDLELTKQVSQLSQTEVKDRTLQAVAPGSLWPADDHVALYGDKIALRVGDSLTVSIVENSQASNAANTNLSRKSDIQAGISDFFHQKKFLDLFKLGDQLITSSSENSHQGSGSTTRQGQLTATITTIVKEVLPNGNLVIQGTRAVAVNHEEQYITITGVVRPADIDSNNVVLSTQVADANISIGGVGVVADKQRSGWGTWVFDWLWPF